MNLQSTRRIGVALSCAVLVLVLAGCERSGNKTATLVDPNAKVRPVTAPTPDEKLTKRLGESATTLEEAGCVFGSYEIDEPEHVDPGQGLDTDSFPPVGGVHFG